MALFLVYFAQSFVFDCVYFRIFPLDTLQRELAVRLFDDLLTDTVLAIDRVATRKLWRAQM